MLDPWLQHLASKFTKFVCILFVIIFICKNEYIWSVVVFLLNLFFGELSTC